MRNFVNWLGDPNKTRQRYAVLSVMLVAAVIADFLIERHHVHFFWDEIPGFGAGYGLIGSLILIIVSKFLGHAWLMKKEDYYD